MNYQNYRMSNDPAIILAVSIAIGVALGIWKIHMWTGVSPKAIFKTGSLLVSLVVLVGWAVTRKDISLKKWCGCVSAAVWLCLIPVLNDAGTIPAVERSLLYGTSTPEGKRWFALTVWQCVVAIGIILLKPVMAWAVEWVKEWSWERKRSR